jgi:hypothetical protein
VSELHFEVGVIVARRAPRTVWGACSWAPAVVLVAPLALEKGAFISSAESDELYYAGAASLSLYASETAHYRDNLQSGRPSVWIALAVESAFPEIVCVTADPYEGEALAEIHGSCLEAVAMPIQLRDWAQAFVATHHIDRPFVKRRRRQEQN